MGADCGGWEAADVNGWGTAHASGAEFLLDPIGRFVLCTFAHSTRSIAYVVIYVVVLWSLNGYVGGICSLAIYETAQPPTTKIVSAGEGSHSSHVGSVEPDQSIQGNAMAVGSGDRLNAAVQVSIRIHSTSGRPPMKMLSAGEGSHSSHAGAVEADKSGMGIVMAGGGCARLDDAAQLDTATSPAKPDPNSPGWTNRYAKKL
jgi:hypothetical protein